MVNNANPSSSLQNLATHRASKVMSSNETFDTTVEFESNHGKKKAAVASGSLQEINYTLPADRNKSVLADTTSDEQQTNIDSEPTRAASSVPLPTPLPTLNSTIYTHPVPCSSFSIHPGTSSSEALA